MKQKALEEILASMTKATEHASASRMVPHSEPPVGGVAQLDAPQLEGRDTLLVALNAECGARSAQPETRNADLAARAARLAARTAKLDARAAQLDALGIKELRARTKLSQTDFAALLGVELGTLRNWEQGRRMPTGPARALLRAIRNDPQNVIRALARAA